MLAASGCMSAAEGRNQTIKQLPAALRAHLRSANIKDNDVTMVSTKLQERLSSNIVSYLQLCILKLRPGIDTDVHNMLRTHSARHEYTEKLEDRVQAM